MSISPSTDLMIINDPSLPTPQYPQLPQSQETTEQRVSAATYAAFQSPYLPSQNALEAQAEHPQPSQTTHNPYIKLTLSPCKLTSSWLITDKGYLPVTELDSFTTPNESRLQERSDATLQKEVPCPPYCFPTPSTAAGFPITLLDELTLAGEEMRQNLSQTTYTAPPDYQPLFPSNTVGFRTRTDPSDRTAQLHFANTNPPPFPIGVSHRHKSKKTSY